jgi:head-tail adaptor
MKTGQTVPTGERRHWVDVYAPGPPVPDGDGGYTTGPPDPRGSWAVQIRPASQRELERIGGATTITGATHLVTGRYHSAVTTQAQLVFRGRVFEVVGVVVPEELTVETIAVCTEIGGGG